MFKSLAAASCVLVCCLGNPADARTVNHAADDVINHHNRSRTVDRSVDNSGNHRGNTNNYNRTNTVNNVTRTRNVDRRRVDRSTHESFFQEITQEQIQHAPIPAPIAPALAGSVPVLVIYGQVDQAGPVMGASISIPLI